MVERVPQLGVGATCLDEIVVAAVLRLGLTVGRRVIAGKVSLGVEYDLRNGLYAHLQRLELEYCGDSFKKLDDGRYRLRLGSDADRAGCELIFTPKKPPIRHGDDGVVRMTRSCVEGPVFAGDKVCWDDVGTIPAGTHGAPRGGGH